MGQTDWDSKPGSFVHRFCYLNFLSLGSIICKIGLNNRILHLQVANTLPFLPSYISWAQIRLQQPCPFSMTQNRNVTTLCLQFFSLLSDPLSRASCPYVFIKIFFLKVTIKLHIVKSNGQLLAFIFFDESAAADTIKLSLLLDILSLLASRTFHTLLMPP